MYAHIAGFRHAVLARSTLHLLLALAATCELAVDGELPQAARPAISSPPAVSAINVLRLVTSGHNAMWPPPLIGADDLPEFCGELGERRANGLPLRERLVDSTRHREAELGVVDDGRARPG